MKEYLAREYLGARAFAVVVKAKSLGKARAKCLKRGWRLEYDEARYDPS